MYLVWKVTGKLLGGPEIGELYFQHHQLPEWLELKTTTKLTFCKGNLKEKHGPRWLKAVKGVCVQDFRDGIILGNDKIKDVTTSG